MLLCEAVSSGRQPHSFYMSYLKQMHFLVLFVYRRKLPKKITFCSAELDKSN
ncbi:hypothetical protein BACINT_04502 [Bacteroides intestinalis DSM 17393]|uniref:Uncharacterized protein n=1 Tax=Bacteroides intestinalis DSM 17393 TaxID=471870 RepID=B3CGI6_9BACE|nr:hypothetical protein BACINT_04502 [Bacteroides intestinalis DSM 17393]